MLQSVKWPRVALRHEKMQFLPVPEAKHRAILIHQLAEQLHRMQVIRLVDRALAVASNIQLRRPR